MRAAQVVSVVAARSCRSSPGGSRADVAAERALPVGRARTLAVGAGLTAAVYLPLLLHSSLPDSTMLFGVLVLGAALLMTRVLRDPRGARGSLDPRLLGIGLLIGLAALTRNEAVWLALTWAWLAWRRDGDRLGACGVRLIGVVAVVSLLVFAPWALRDWPVFGNPLPGQAATNALSLSGFDIFAWNDPPTLARYLAAGPGAPARDARRRASATTCSTSCCSWASRSRSIGLSPCRGRAATGPCGPSLLVALLDLPRHEPAVPGRDDVGHLPPRRGAGRTCC